MGGAEFPKEPVIFQKPFSSLLYGSDKLTFKLPKSGNEIHHEIELGYMVGK